MKIEFSDGSFVTFDFSPQNKLTVSMCGLADDGKKATMVSSVLDEKDVDAVLEYLKNGKQ